jgi:hypothetical protein
MFRTFSFIVAATILSTVSLAQERYVKPVDEGREDASFLSFRTKLIAAAERRDAKYILSIVGPAITSGFGGDEGIAGFRRTWKINDKKSRFWDEFLRVLKSGGKFEQSDGPANFFTAPYLYSQMPDDLDHFEYHAIFGNNVNLREKPDQSSRVISQLSYNIVKIDEPAAIKKKTGPGEWDWEYDWHKVTTLGGRSGWVKAEYVRSAIAARAGFEKKRGSWKMVFFVEGD